MSVVRTWSLVARCLGLGRIRSDLHGGEISRVRFETRAFPVKATDI